MKKIIFILFGIVVVVALVVIVKKARTEEQIPIYVPQEIYTTSTTTTDENELFTVTMPVAFVKQETPFPAIGRDQLPSTPKAHATYAVDSAQPENGMINLFLFDDEGLKLPEWEAKYLTFDQYGMIGTFMTSGWFGDEVKFQQGLAEGFSGKVFMAARDGMVVYLQMVSNKENRDETDFAYQTVLSTLQFFSESTS